MISFSKGNLVDIYGIDPADYYFNQQRRCFIYEKEDNARLNPINAEEFTLFSWNIYKQKKHQWDHVFKKALHQSDIILLQEAKHDDSLVHLVESNGFKAIHVSAFKNGDHSNGVMNIAKTIPSLYCAQKESEPWIRFPKSGLITTHHLTNGKILMVSNFHAINFSIGIKKFTQQVENVLAVLKSHDGPIILAGDFNTWRNARYEMIDKMISDIGLNEVRYDEDQRTRVLGKALDYVFTRGIEIKSTEVLNTKASDHKPIKITMGIDMSE